MTIDPLELHRLSTYVTLTDLWRGRRVLEVGVGSGAGGAWLAGHGAREILCVDGDRRAVDRASAQHRRGNLSFRAAEPTALADEGQTFDVIVCGAGAGSGPDSIAPERLRILRRLLSPSGRLLVLAAPGDVTGAGRGTVTGEGAARACKELERRLATLFGPTRLLAVSPFAAMAVGEPRPVGEAGELTELELDASLAENAPDEVAFLAALTGPEREPRLPFTLVRLPVPAVSEPARAESRPLAVPVAEPRRTVDADELARVQLRLAERERELATTAAERQSLEWRIAELLGRLESREAPAAAAPGHDDRLAEVLVRMERALADKNGELDERDAFIAELEEELASQRAQAIAGRAGSARFEELESELRELRSRTARAEGEVLRLTRMGGAGSSSAAVEKSDARWKAAEAKSDELWRKIGEMQKELETNREQAVENARQQRQAQQVALTRATEEGMKKLVSVQDQLARTERERKELESTSQALRADLERARTELQGRGAGTVGGAARASTPVIDSSDILDRLEELDEVLRILSATLREEEHRITALEEALHTLRAQAESMPTRADLERALGTSSLSEQTREATLAAREERLRALVQDIAHRDAELVDAHHGIAAARQHVLDVVSFLRRTRDQLMDILQPAGKSSKAAAERSSGESR